MKRISKNNNFNLITSSKQPGFTIVELLVVIVVIAILAAITIVSYTGISTKATVAAIQSDLANNANILKMYYTTYSSYPTAIDSVTKCPTAPNPDTNYCLKASNGITLSYQPSSTSSTVTATDFALYASKNTTYYRTASDTATTPQAVTKTCPYGFIVAPGSSTYSTTDFCVMKYEAKQVGTTTTPISQAAGLPWTTISQTTAATNSQNVASCNNCHLITEAEWMTIAQNVLSVASNWRDNVVGTASSSTNYIYSGHNDNNPANALAASTNDNDGYYGTGNSSTSGANQKRTLTLSNGEVIWDISGNVYDWTAGTVQTPVVQPGITSAGYTWREWTAITNAGTLAVNSSPAGTGLTNANMWNSSNGIGHIYSSSDEVGLRGFIRGGGWNCGSYAGVLSLLLGFGPGGADAIIGFRVAASSGL